MTGIGIGTWRTARADWGLLGLMAATALLHGLTAGRYDFFRNELYFIVCGRHPDFGYVDQPPLVPLISAATQAFGQNLWLLRLPAVLAAVLILPLTARLTRLLGGDRQAGWLAAGAAALSPGLAALSAAFTTSTFEPLAWTGLTYCLAKAIATGDRRALLWGGAVAGLAMEAKYGVAIWMIGLLAGLAATPERRLLAWRQAWTGAGIALMLAAPSLIWQQVHGWPFFTAIFGPAVSGGAYHGTLPRFLLQQGLVNNLLTAPLWLAGLILPFLQPRLAPMRLLPLAYLVALAIDYLGGGKNYYLFPVYPSLFALGAAGLAPYARWKTAPWLAACLLAAAPLAPVVLPLLSPAGLAAYLDRTGLRPAPIERASLGAPLTQLFSDEFGWKGLESKVAAVYRGLPEEDRRKAVIMAANYGEAAAIDFYGAPDGLPPAIALENQYHVWGPRGAGSDVIIHAGGRLERWQSACRTVTVADRFGDPFAMPYENDRPIFICRDLTRPLAEIWPLLQSH